MSVAEQEDSHVSLLAATGWLAPSEPPISPPPSFAHAADGLLLAFGAAAWKTVPRDRLIGWDGPTRQRNLPLVANHAHYLILLWIRLVCMASHLLALAARRLPRDWHGRYR